MQSKISKYPKQLFHLAIPCRALEPTIHFYQTQLGCELTRSYDDRACFNFFSHQLVCHLSPNDIIPNPKMYPRHFGMTFQSMSDFEGLVKLVEKAEINFYERPFTRFVGRDEEHKSCFLMDPSYNLLEFKCYKNPAKMY